jgi:hypothetical protein
MEVRSVQIAEEDNEILSVNFKTTVKNIIHLVYDEEVVCKSA